MKASDIPVDWFILYDKRPGSQKRQIDRFFVTPDGYKLRSLPECERFLACAAAGGDPSEFSKCASATLYQRGWSIVGNITSGLKEVHIESNTLVLGSYPLSTPKAAAAAAKDDEDEVEDGASAATAPATVAGSVPTAARTHRSTFKVALLRGGAPTTADAGAEKAPGSSGAIPADPPAGGTKRKAAAPLDSRGAAETLLLFSPVPPAAPSTLPTAATSASASTPSSKAAPAAAAVAPSASIAVLEQAVAVAKSRVAGVTAQAAKETALCDAAQLRLDVAKKSGGVATARAASAKAGSDAAADGKVHAAAVCARVAAQKVEAAAQAKASASMAEAADARRAYGEAVVELKKAEAALKGAEAAVLVAAAAVAGGEQ